MKNLTVKFVLRAAPFVYMGLIWFQSARFNPDSVMQLPLTALIPLGIVLESLHFVQFGILYLFVVLFYYTFGPLTQQRNMVAAGVAVLYAVLDELHQFFVPFRSASSWDLVKNLLGIALVWILVHRVSRAKNSFFMKMVSNFHKR